ncbi:menaquinone biosynthesis decarboxylase [Campylobacter corcagiensis]|uniref:Menaquinone biosynthesis decarboxylase n=1 Tax=Campylobacter corcagiensis TaxID=1448857 RepID=A0A7M1LFF4_9BACT|nr:menaquinone biosynthesis decarboxylase [Campylobacter corcagiensis]QKF64487.1 1,4-dihydroxy-2-naphthoate octaprenyltransferase [Campylobacter corcagiensis]QOQ87332.1 menaquinone biosynthesis decarboxylase [Campylobacter corcagiensis]
MREWIEKFRSAGLLKVIDEPVDIDLEIGHISYVEVKKDDSKALLFTKPTDKNGKIYPPVLTNTFGSFKALELVLGRSVESVADEISSLLKPKKPANFKEKVDFLKYLFSLRTTFTKKLKGPGECQKHQFLGDSVNLFDMPHLKTWEKDGGAFITMGQVYTKDLNGDTQNLGMYRLQIYSKNELGMHWQIHKDGANFFNEYKKAGKKMPVSVAIGGDPLYIWCGQAPLPHGIFELLLYGFIRKTPAKLVKSLTNDIYIPHDSDFVIEGFVDPNELKDEGPFGDHTGFYTPILPFPVMRVSAITHKDDPIYHATVVGKPPLEDKYMGHATERIFLPLFKVTAPDLIDYKMPENGVFHNLILAKINAWYPAHARQMMHAFWGVGQMSFVKHAIFVDKDAKDLSNYDAIARYALNRITTKSLIVSEGVCDQLDHASPNACFGGKLAVDATVDLEPLKPQILSDSELLDKFRSVDKNIVNLKQYYTDTKNPIVFISVEKKGLIKELFDKLLKFKAHFKILCFFDTKNDVNNAYMSVWRLTNNTDAIRDLFIDGDQICVDATQKSQLDGYTRGWPDEVDCTKSVIDSLRKRGLINVSDEFIEKFEITPNLAP